MRKGVPKPRARQARDDCEAAEEDMPYIAEGWNTLPRWSAHARRWVRVGVRKSNGYSDRFVSVGTAVPNGRAVWIQACVAAAQAGGHIATDERKTIRQRSSE